MLFRRHYRSRHIFRLFLFVFVAILGKKRQTFLVYRLEMFISDMLLLVTLTVLHLIRTVADRAENCCLGRVDVNLHFGKKISLLVGESGVEKILGMLIDGCDWCADQGR